MANFIGAIEKFNPYVQQIPVEAYTKVGMFKEQQYQAGVQKIQEAVDHIAGLDIANEGGRQYLRNRVDELTKSLNKFSQVDFSNPNNVSQLVGLAKPLYQDENIVNDVINTGIYRKWAKEAGDAFKSGKMELGQYVRESSQAAQWLNSDAAGAAYTGRQTPNTATKKDLLDRVLKAKKDGMEKNEYVYDLGYDKDKPYYVKTTDKHYSEAEFNNLVTNAIMTDKDREMLMNEHWYENQGVPTEVLQKQDIAMYQSKINLNNSQIEYLTGLAKLKTGDDKLRTEQTIKDLQNYNTELQNGKIKFLQELNLADPTSRDVFHRDLAESRYVQSLDVFTDEVKKEELTKNEQWFTEKQAELEAAKTAVKAATKTGKDGKPKSMDEITDEVSVYTPVAPDAPKTELSLNTIQRGWQIKNDEINGAMNSLIGKLQENGVDVNQFIAGWDQVQVGGKAGAAMNVPRFKDNAAKQKFYNLVAGLNFAYTKEAQDGHLDNQSFTKWVKENFGGYKDDDPNSKFTLADKTVSDALNTMKGTTALLPRLEKLFSDKGVTRTLAQIDEAIKNKKDMANVYREAIFKSNALKKDEMDVLKKMSDDDLLSNNFFFDADLEQKRLGDKVPKYSVKKESDGTYSIIQQVYEPVGMDDKRGILHPDYEVFNKWIDRKPLDERKLAGGFKNSSEAQKAFANGGQLSMYSGISKESLEKAEKFVRQTYSYVQENLNTTVTNLKEDEPAYNAVKDGLALFLNRAKLQAGTQDIQLDGGIDPRTIAGIKEVEVLGATVSNTEDIFNPNPMYEVNFKATLPTGEKGELKEVSVSGRVSLKSFLATNPNYRTSEYAKYFAPALYSQKDAYERIKATVNPLEGSEASYANRGDIQPVYNRVNQDGSTKFVYDDPQGKTASGRESYGNEYQWETIPVEKDGKQTMVSYQVVSLGQNTNLGNIKNKDGQQYQPGAFYIKLKIPTSTGEPKVIFLKKPSGESLTFNSASYAHYTVRDLIFNNPEIKLDEIDQASGQPNYLTTDPSTIRGIFNSQLSYNGYSKLETIKIKDALGKEIQKQQAKELQYAK